MTEFDDALRTLRVAVLCGGPGAEREVSLASGDNVHKALREGGFDSELVIVPEVNPEACLESLDCQVAVMMLHGEFGEDGHAQEILERRGVAFTGSSAEACAFAMDKDRCKRLFIKEGVPTPKWLALDTPASALADFAAAGMTPPVVVKPNSRGSSVGISIVRDALQLPEAFEKAFAVDTHVLVETFIAGREMTIGWLDGVILPAIELVPDGVFYDYNAKYLSEKTKYICPAPMAGDDARDLDALIAKVSEIVSVRDLARVDILFGDSGPLVLEVNTLPGFTLHSLLPLAAAKYGMPMPALCAKLVGMAARRAGLA